MRALRYCILSHLGLLYKHKFAISLRKSVGCPHSKEYIIWLWIVISSSDFLVSF